MSSWTGAQSSDWNAAGNWSTGTVPTSSTNAIIDDVSTNVPTIFDPSNSHSTSVGSSSGSNASLTVSGISAIWNLSESLGVGSAGTGLLNIENGAIVATGGLAAIGNQVTGVGTVNVNGTGSSWTVGSDLAVGQSGHGSLNISDNSQVVTGAFSVIGNLAGSTGIVHIRESGQLITISDLPVGASGNGTLTVSSNGSATNSNIIIAQQSGAVGQVNIGADVGATADTPGILNTAAVSFGQGSGSLNFNHTDNSGNYRFNPLIGTGTGRVNVYAGSTALYLNNPYAGQTRVIGGTLIADNENGSATGTSSVQVDAAGTLRGNGFITGVVTVGGTLSPGTTGPGVLTLGQLTLNSGSTAVFRLNDPNGNATFASFVNNDRVDVSGNLTLGGTLSATISAAGVYRLFNYGGTLAGSFAAANYIPGRPDFEIGNVTVDTSINHQVNLTVREDEQTLQFWDGSHTTASGQPLGAGGNGIWNSGNTNWVDITGADSGDWSSTVGVFAGSTGTVTLEGNQAFQVLQFLTTGYTLQATGAGNGALVIGLADGGTLNIARNVSATITAPIIDGAGSKLIVVGGGAVTLAGINTYSGSTQIVSSLVQANADSAFGAATGGITLDGSLIRLGAAFDLGAARTITLISAGGGVDSNGFNSTLASPLQGEGEFHKLGAGTLTLTSAATNYTGKTVISAGTLSLSGPAQIAQSASVQVDSGAVFDIAPSSAAQRVQGLSGAGQVTLGVQVLSLTNAYNLFSGVISGSGGFAVLGGVELLSGDNIYSGLTTVGDGSTLALIGNGEISQSAEVAIGSSGRFNISLAADGASIKSLTGAGLVELGAQTLTLTDASGIFAGNISGDGSLIVQAGTQTLQGNNPYRGMTTIASGATLKLAIGGQIKFSESVQSNGTFDISGTTNGAIIKSLGGGGVVKLGAQTLTINDAADTFAGQISGSGGLTITGGEQLLGGANTYTGPTTVGLDRVNRTFGTLGAAAANVFSPQSDFIVLSGGTLKLYAFDQTIASLTNAGLVQFEDDPHTILTVSGNYIGNGGTIHINTTLGDSSSETDKLVVQGETAGLSNVLVTNINGTGAMTAGNGIQIIQVGGASNGTFQLSNRLAAGAYEYLLYHGGTGADVNDGNWYLRSSIDTPPIGPPTSPQPPAPPLPNYRIEVPLDSMLPALASRFGIEMLGTYHERYGEDALLSACLAQPRSANCSAGTGYWMRAFVTSGDVHYGGATLATQLSDFKNYGPSYDFELSGFQVGLDVLRLNHADDSRDVLGIFAGTGTADGTARAVFGGTAGSVSLDGFSFGGYWTHHGRLGWYLDTVLQGTRYTPVETTSILNEHLRTDGWSVIASAEGGYPFALGGSGWVLEPQAQVIYQYLALKDGSDDFGQISFGNTDEWLGRLGVRAAKTWQLDDGRAINTWARTNWWKNFGTDARITFASSGGADPVQFSTSLGEEWAQFDVGVSAQMAKNMSVFAVGEYSMPLDHGKGHTVGGRVGMKIVW